MTNTRLFYLDGLRGILAVIVFVHHFFYTFYPDIIFGGQYHEYLRPGLSFDKVVAFTPLNLLFNPGFAIHFFFLLSGYVQSRHYFGELSLQIIQKSFLKRYFRLAIPVVAVLLILFIFHKLHFFTKDLVPPDAITGAWVKSLLPNHMSFGKVLVHGFSDSFLRNSNYYQVLWTMPIELQNSWMVFVLLFVTHQLPRKLPVLIFWIGVQLFVLQSYYGVAFTFGVLICHAELYSAHFRTFFSNTSVKLFCLLAGIYFASYPYIGFEKSTEQGLYAPISFFEKWPHITSYLSGDLLLFCFLLFSDPLKKILAKPLFQYFGKISFMFYLFHLIILLSFSPVIFQLLFVYVGKVTAIAITGLASMLLVTASSHLLYVLVDKPTLVLCNYYNKKLFGI